MARGLPIEVDVGGSRSGAKAKNGEVNPAASKDLQSKGKPKNWRIQTDTRNKEGLRVVLGMGARVERASCEGANWAGPLQKESHL